MKRLNILLIILLSLVVLACKQENKKLDEKNQIDYQNVNLSGKLINFDQNLKDSYLRVYVYDLGKSDRIEYPCPIKKDGTFEINFKILFPQDIDISYNTNLILIVHPGDSLYVEFDAKQNIDYKLLEDIRFSGDAAKLNSDFSVYLQDFYKVRPSLEESHQSLRSKSQKEYIIYQDSLRKMMHDIRNKFIKTQENKELVTWTYYNIEMEYFCELLNYHNSGLRPDNLLGKKAEIDIEIYDFLDGVPDIDLNSLINTKTSYMFAEMYLGHISKMLFRNNNNSINKEEYDSLLIADVLDCTKNDTLLRDLVLSRYFNRNLKYLDVSNYEKFRNIIEQNMTTPYLKEPLEKHYKATKEHLKNPKIPSNAKLSFAKYDESSSLFKSTIKESLGKITYVDCWGTWCGACIMEFPYSKTLMDKYKDEDVSFVYLCFSSEPDDWKAIISKYELGGNHFILNEKQSEIIQKELKIYGFPTYLLLDAKGNVIEKGGKLEIGPGTGLIYDLIDKQLSKENI